MPASASHEALAAVARAQEAVRAGQLAAALRVVDRAWRTLPDDGDAIAPIYACLLAGEDSDADACANATLRLIARAQQQWLDPELEALAVAALLRLGRGAEARARLSAGLERFCVETGGALAQAADGLVRDIDLEADAAPAGWVGLDGTLAFVGALAPGADPRALRIDCEHGAAVGAAVLFDVRNGLQRFRFAPPLPWRGARFDFRIEGTGLAGSGRSAQPDFMLDGRAHGAGRRIGGWVRLGWRPAQPLRLSVKDEQANAAWVDAQNGRGGHGEWSFDLELPAHGLRGSRFEVRVRLPDGELAWLPDAPLLLEPAARLPERARHRALQWIAPRAAGQKTARGKQAAAAAQRPAVDVIVPVHGARKETLACLESVLWTLAAPDRLVVVDDASDDPLLVRALDELAAGGRIELLRNAANRGFAASVNRALALDSSRDAVVLNSDALVFGSWLARLHAAAYSGSKVATATPLANSGSIAAYPHEDFDTLETADAAALDGLAAGVNAGLRAPLPVGVGFCLYLRRDALRAIGLLDEAVFGPGYGEETDYCLRAAAQGWSHVLAADVFVYHAGGASFGARRAALLERSQRLLELRHPGFERFVAGYLAADPVAPLRRRLDEERLRAFDGAFVLLVTLTMTGGVDRFVRAQCERLRARGLHPLVLRPALTLQSAGKGGRGMVEAADTARVELWTDALVVPNLRYAAPSDFAAILELLRALRIDHVQVQHFLGLDARLLEGVRGLGRPYDVFLHDYAWFCPRVTLIDGSGRYCGEPDVAACERCVRRNGSNLTDHISVAALRRRSAAWLGAARSVFAACNDAAERYRRRFADLPVRVAPYGLPLVPPPAPVRAGNPDEPVRVALIGAIGQHKGYEVLLKCARDAARRHLPLQFVVVGFTEDDAALENTGRVAVTGRYTDGEVAQLLRREQVDVALFASVWPETWCFALDHAVSAGLPVLAFDLGAIAERLRAAGWGTLLPLDAAPARLNDELLRAAGRGEDAAPRASADTNEYAQAQARILRIQGGGPAYNDRPLDKANDISHAHPAITKSDMTKTSTPQDITPPEGLSASVQVLPLPVGLYLFSVQAAEPALARAAGRLALPAIHIGLGPGVRPEHVEFVTGPATNGNWLFAQGDMLVAKVTGAGSTLILTSVREPGGQTLSLKVERLEHRVDAEIAQSAQARPEPVRAPAGNGAAHTEPARVGAGGGASVAVPLQINAHIRARGDRTFANVPWAGRAGQGMWIESFSVLPLEALAAHDIEYKALTASGFETPWMSDDQMCGTRGMGVPLIGFAVRLRPGARTADFDCEYSGYFQSGSTSGPFRNGTPCRSNAAGDPLEGIQIRLVRRVGAAQSAAAVAQGSAVPARAMAGEAAKPKPAPAAKRAAAKRAPAAPARKPARTQEKSRRA